MYLVLFAGEKSYGDRVIGTITTKEDKDIFLQQRKQYGEEGYYEIIKIKDKDLKDDKVREKIDDITYYKEIINIHGFTLTSNEYEYFLESLSFFESNFKWGTLSPLVKEYLPFLKFSEEELRIIDDYLGFLYHAYKADFEADDIFHEGYQFFDVKKFIEYTIFNYEER